MSVPTVFHPILQQDFTLNPIQVHRRFVIGSSSYASTGSGYRYWNARYFSEKIKLGTATTYPTNSTDGSNMYVIWNSIDSQYYRFPYDRFATKEHANFRYSYKNLSTSASILSIPRNNFGEGIKPGSVEITSSGNSFYLKDDGNGNLYDVDLNTASFASTTGLVAHWSFKNLFKMVDKNAPQPNGFLLSNGRIDYASTTHEPSVQTELHDVVISTTIDRVDTLLGSSIYLANPNIGEHSYAFTPQHDDYEFGDSDFTIAFWTGVDSSQPGSGYTSIISKNGTVTKEILSQDGYSSSRYPIATNVYPYDISMMTDGDDLGKIIFRRSNGIQTTQLTSSYVAHDGWSHICVTRSGSLCSMYVNGTLYDTEIDRTGNCTNGYDLIFGARNVEYADSFRGRLDEIRFYNRALTPTAISSLSSREGQEYLQTAVVGNVFYKSGEIVISPADPKYLQAFSDPTIRWKSTHTIYQYECLTRIKKGSCNLTLNPTARVTADSDLLSSDFTGSLSPYCTGIGLYNDKFELLAVAKLGQPLKMRDDVDINILVRWDV